MLGRDGKLQREAADFTLSRKVSIDSTRTAKPTQVAESITARELQHELGKMTPLQGALWGRREFGSSDCLPKT